VTCGLPHLKRRAEFVRVARSGRSSAAVGLVLQVLRRSGDGDMTERSASLRLGVTASRKIGNAVERNRARRRLRSAARAVLPQLAAPGFDYVMIARRETLRRPFPNLVADLKDALKRLGVLSGGRALPR
jgi:ribonuclease P protein component